MKLVDRVAYINHDIDDAIRAGVLRARRPAGGAVELLGDDRLAADRPLVHDLVESSEVAGDIVQSSRLGEAMLELRAFLFDTRLPEQGRLREETERAAFVIGRCSTTTAPSSRPRASPMPRSPRPSSITSPA